MKKQCVIGVVVMFLGAAICGVESPEELIAKFRASGAVVKESAPSAADRPKVQILSPAEYRVESANLRRRLSKFAELAKSWEEASKKRVQAMAAEQAASQGVLGRIATGWAVGKALLVGANEAEQKRLSQRLVEAEQTAQVQRCYFTAEGGLKDADKRLADPQELEDAAWADKGWVVGSWILDARKCIELLEEEAVKRGWKLAPEVAVAPAGAPGTAGLLASVHDRASILHAVAVQHS